MDSKRSENVGTSDVSTYERKNHIMITSKQRSFLRKMVQDLQPTVYIGKNGLTGTVLDELEKYLDAHELVKVKVQEGCLDNIKDLANDSANSIGADVVQVIGRKFSLYRQSENKLIELPKENKKK